MKSIDEVKTFFKNARIGTNPYVDQAVLTDAIQAGGLGPERHTAHAGGNLRRYIVRHGFKKLAVAAALVTALIVTMEHWGGSANGTGIAWGNVRDAFLAQRWVHVKYDNGRETWSNLLTGDHYLKDWNGQCWAEDRTRNIRQVYDPAFGQHISEGRTVRDPNAILPPCKPRAAWESVVGPWEAMAEHGGRGDWEVERHSERIDGAELARFDCYFHDAAGRRLLIRKIWADPKTRLPVTIWERLQLAERERQKRESITGAFDFPETGPADIYDLGVSRDLPVAKDYDKLAVASVVEVLQAAKAALKRFPPRYRVVVWDNSKETEIEIVFRDGRKIRHDHYFNFPVGLHPQYHLALPATAQQALDWARTQIPVSTYLFDGEKEYYRHYLHPVFPNDPAEVRVLKDTDGSGLPTSSRPIEQQWFHAKLRPADFEVIADAPAGLSKYVGLRTNRGDIRREYYIDPEHDYLCVRNIWWKQRSGQWEKEREYEYSDLTQLPSGQWYAAKQGLVTYPDPERGTARGGENLNMDVQVLDEGDFPPGTFDGEKLLEGAKLETY
jgi:hypothetical protein